MNAGVLHWDQRSDTKRLLYTIYVLSRNYPTVTHLSVSS